MNILLTYREIKAECEARINAIESKLNELSNRNVNIEDDLNLAMKALSSLNGIGTLNGGKLPGNSLVRFIPKNSLLKICYIEPLGSTKSLRLLL